MERLKALKSDNRVVFDEELKAITDDRPKSPLALPLRMFDLRPMHSDVDKYLAARWYHLNRGSAYSSTLGKPSWLLPHTSASASKFGYVPAR